MTEDTNQTDVNPRVLVVEDEEIVRDILPKVLSEEGYRVDAVETGEDGLKALDNHLYDLVLLDLIMPNMDGFAVLEIKAQDQTISDIPVIVLSAMDPQRQPIVTKSLTVSRQQGLSARDLAAMVQAVTQTLRPRFGAPIHLEASDV